MALDIGERRIGVALSDPSQTVASPLAVLDAMRIRKDPAELTRLIEDYDVCRVVVGLPLSLDGSEGPQAGHVRATVGRLAQFLPPNIEYFDERYSSSEAKRALTGSGVSAREQRGMVDSIAAALFLQGYLDAQGTSNKKGT
jgi:putative Holliday junction resolvase